jgi:arylsulfatase A-like enzyme
MYDIDEVDPAFITHFRRVYFSMCVEADQLLGQLLDALDHTGGRNRTYIVMISDHGEDAAEHRQNGKNNMYDSGSRVPLILSGPGIKAGTQLTTLTSLNDIYPTIMAMAQKPIPDGLAGSSLLQLLLDEGLAEETLASSNLASSSSTTPRKDYVTAQYHSVYSVTGLFMLRQGDFKVGSLKAHELAQIHASTDYCLVAFCTWILTTAHHSSSSLSETCSSRIISHRSSSI